MPFNPKHKGLTLIELIVMIAIITILIVILLPPSLGPRISSTRTKCAAQMKHWANVVHTYAAANDGYVPVIYAGQPWSSASHPYADPKFWGPSPAARTRFLTCPSFTSAPGTTPVTYFFSTGYDTAAPVVSPAPVEIFKLRDVNHWSTYALMADCDPGPNLTFHSMADVTPQLNPALTGRLSGYANVMFLDGHVEQDKGLADFNKNIPATPTAPDLNTKPWLCMKWPF